MVGDMKEVCLDTRNLILVHHERPDETGFPKNLSAKTLSPLSCIYILAHEFSHRLVAKPLTKEILEKSIADFQAHYTSDNFKKPYESFKKVFKKH
jgi:response regulator RpfG family c-di-GMP phosphodiesterase